MSEPLRVLGMIDEVYFAAALEVRGESTA